MGTTMHRRSPPRGRSPYSSSPRRNHSSPPRSLHRKERSPDHHRSSMRTKSPVRTSISHSSRSPAEEKLRDRGRSLKYERSEASRRARSPLKEKFHDRARSPKYRRSRSPRREKRPKHRQNSSPVRARSSSPSRNRISRSPSPPTMRLKRALEDRKAGQLMDKEHRRGATRGNENGRQKEHAAVKEIPTEKRSLHDHSEWSSRTVRRDRSISPAEENQRSHYSSGSPSRSSRKQARDEVTRTSDAEQHGNDEDDSVARMKSAEEALEAKQKEKPSFELSGKLAEETNRVRGVTLLFTEPADARKPDIRWRLYVFKAGEVLNEPLYVHRQSCYLFGRERRVADVPTDHPSCSKQHAVIQYRLVEKEQPDGMMKKQVRPYLMDLGSTNGTYINDNRIEPQRYYELFEKDTIKFGNSSREYVILHENSVQ